MAKSYSVAPVLRDGSTFYVATFRNSTGKRVTRGLGTPEKSRAKSICAGLEELWLKQVKSSADTPIDVPLDAARLFFGDAKTKQLAEPVADLLLDATVQNQLKDFPKAVRSKILPVLVERARLYRENEAQRLEVASLKRALAEAQRERVALERSVLGSAVVASKNIPNIHAALEMFIAHMKAETTDFNARVVGSVAKRFVASLPPERKTLADVTVDDVCGFLDIEVAKGAESKRATRKDALRRRLGRMLYWSANRWQYACQMKRVPAVEGKELERERGEIHFHQLEDAEKAIKKLPNDYWKTLVSTLLYAGLQLAELCWLRVSDVKIAPDGKSGKLIVDTVEDGDDKHLLKTAHRKRTVNLHPKLLEMLKTYLKSGSAGKTYLFAVPEDMRVEILTPEVKDAAGNVVEPAVFRERWLTNSLSTALRGHKGGEKRKATPALLPKGMNAKSLRRTFCSLLIREGKCTTDEGAAVAGNTPEVFSRNYGKRRGEEVTVNF